MVFPAECPKSQGWKIILLGSPSRASPFLLKASKWGVRKKVIKQNAKSACGGHMSSKWCKSFFWSAVHLGWQYRASAVSDSFFPQEDHWKQVKTQLLRAQIRWLLGLLTWGAFIFLFSSSWIPCRYFRLLLVLHQLPEAGTTWFARVAYYQSKTNSPASHLVVLVRARRSWDWSGLGETRLLPPHLLSLYSMNHTTCFPSRAFKIAIWLPFWRISWR